MKKIDYNSPVVLTFFFISLLVLILNYVTGGLTNRLFFSVYDSSLTNPLTYVRLFTHVLGHSNISHFFNNMLIILLVGPILEEKYGSKNMIIMIAITALITGLFFVLIFDNSALLGASGIDFMFIMLASFVNVQKGKIQLTVILIAILYLTGEVYSIVFVTDNISQITHLLGGACGICFGYVLNKKQ